ncbi:hypothetical protein DIPPA_29665 [Diplonema papillatum]|nr:hypothetical protein DIPPA_29665 [Diplonema papillatum]
MPVPAWLAPHGTPTQEAPLHAVVSPSVGPPSESPQSPFDRAGCDGVREYIQHCVSDALKASGERHYQQNVVLWSAVRALDDRLAAVEHRLPAHKRPKPTRPPSQPGADLRATTSNGPGGCAAACDEPPRRLSKRISQLESQLEQFVAASPLPARPADRNRAPAAAPSVPPRAVVAAVEPGARGERPLATAAWVAQTPMTGTSYAVSPETQATGRGRDSVLTDGASIAGVRLNFNDLTAATSPDAACGDKNHPAFGPPPARGPPAEGACAQRFDADACRSEGDPQSRQSLFEKFPVACAGSEQQGTPADGVAAVQKAPPGASKSRGRRTSNDSSSTCGNADPHAPSTHAWEPAAINNEGGKKAPGTGNSRSRKMTNPQAPSTNAREPAVSNPEAGKTVSGTANSRSKKTGGNEPSSTYGNANPHALSTNAWEPADSNNEGGKTAPGNPRGSRKTGSIESSSACAPSTDAWEPADGSLEGGKKAPSSRSNSSRKASSTDTTCGNANPPRSKQRAAAGAPPTLPHLPGAQPAAGEEPVGLSVDTAGGSRPGSAQPLAADALPRGVLPSPRAAVDAKGGGLKVDTLDALLQRAEDPLRRSDAALASRVLEPRRGLLAGPGPVPAGHKSAWDWIPASEPNSSRENEPKPASAASDPQTPSSGPDNVPEHLPSANTEHRTSRNLQVSSWGPDNTAEHLPSANTKHRVSRNPQVSSCGPDNTTEHLPSANTEHRTSRNLQVTSCGPDNTTEHHASSANPKHRISRNPQVPSCGAETAEQQPQQQQQPSLTDDSPPRAPAEHRPSTANHNKSAPTADSHLELASPAAEAPGGGWSWGNAYIHHASAADLVEPREPSGKASGVEDTTGGASPRLWSGVHATQVPAPKPEPATRREPPRRKEPLVPGSQRDSRSPPGPVREHPLWDDGRRASPSRAAQDPPQEDWHPDEPSLNGSPKRSEESPGGGSAARAPAVSGGSGAGGLAGLRAPSLFDCTDEVAGAVGGDTSSAEGDAVRTVPQGSTLHTLAAAGEWANLRRQAARRDESSPRSSQQSKPASTSHALPARNEWEALQRQADESSPCSSSQQSIPAQRSTLHARPAGNEWANLQQKDESPPCSSSQQSIPAQRSTLHARPAGNEWANLQQKDESPPCSSSQQSIPAQRSTLHARPAGNEWANLQQKDESPPCSSSQQSIPAQRSTLHARPAGNEWANLQQKDESPPCSSSQQSIPARSNTLQALPAGSEWANLQQGDESSPCSSSQQSKPAQGSTSHALPAGTEWAKDLRRQAAQRGACSPSSASSPQSCRQPAHWGTSAVPPRASEATGSPPPHDDLPRHLLGTSDSSTPGRSAETREFSPFSASPSLLGKPTPGRTLDYSPGTSGSAEVSRQAAQRDDSSPCSSSQQSQPAQRSALHALLGGNEWATLQQSDESPPRSSSQQSKPVQRSALHALLGGNEGTNLQQRDGFSPCSSSQQSKPSQRSTLHALPGEKLEWINLQRQAAGGEREGAARSTGPSNSRPALGSPAQSRQAGGPPQAGRVAASPRGGAVELLSPEADRRREVALESSPFFESPRAASASSGVLARSARSSPSASAGSFRGPSAASLGRAHSCTGILSPLRTAESTHEPSRFSASSGALAQNTQNPQYAQNTQNTQNAQSTQNAQNAQSAQNSPSTSAGASFRGPSASSLARAHSCPGVLSPLRFTPPHSTGDHASPPSSYPTGTAGVHCADDEPDFEEPLSPPTMSSIDPQDLDTSNPWWKEG